MPGLDATVGKEAPVLFLVLSFLIILGYVSFKTIPQIVGQAIEFIKARDAAFISALDKMSSDLQRALSESEESHQKFIREQNDMWRVFVQDQWKAMAQSLDVVAEQIMQLSSKVDAHDRRTMAEHKPHPKE